jgi:hypothetical protein
MPRGMTDYSKLLMSVICKLLESDGFSFTEE